MELSLITNDKYKDLKYLVPASFSNIDNANSPKTCFTTRHGGVSGDNFLPLKSMNLNFKEIDTFENVVKNYEIISDALGFSVDKVVYMHQRHTDNIIVCDNDYMANRHKFLDDEIADAAVTNMKGVLLTVKVADCVPVLFYDEKNSAIGAAHCGWKGTIQSLQQKTAQKMSEIYGTDIQNLKVAIGVCISQCCYEVSESFFEDFYNKFGQRVTKFFRKDTSKIGKYYCNLRGINKMLLTEIGIEERNIEISEYCTYCNADLFFSHRRDGEKRGTLAGFIGLQ